MSSGTRVKCRICLVQTKVNETYELFASDDGVTFKIEEGINDEFSYLKLYEKVEYCCGVRMHNKLQMPSRICEKCFSMVHMWFNFRQMCYNSQVFLTTQILDVVDIDQELEDLQTVRSKIKLSIPKEENEELIVCLTTDKQEEIDEYLNDENDANDHITKYDSDNENTKLKISDDFFTEREDLLEDLTQNDYNEAMEYLNAEDDEQLEDFIKHCATDNLSIKQLKEKAIKRHKPKLKKQVSKPTTQAVKEPKNDIKLPKPSTYMCYICGHVYTKKPLYQHHMRMHSDVKPYECEICEKAFRIMSDLKNHMYSHTREKPFKCKYCDRHFMHRSHRHRHERIHTNSRPYKCTECGKSFTYSAILKNHLKLHTGVKDFICSICDKCFTLAHQLKAHMATISHKQKEAVYEASGYKIIYETVAD